MKNDWVEIDDDYLINCQISESLFHFEYFEKTKEFYLYCFQSSTQLILVILPYHQILNLYNYLYIILLYFYFNSK